MSADDMRKVIIIRDIRSNIFEEVILILKNRPGHGYEIITKKEAGKNKRQENESFIIKEAELIINDFLRSKQLRNIPDKSAGKKPIKKFWLNFSINTVLLASALLLVFLAMKI